MKTGFVVAGIVALVVLGIVILSFSSDRDSLSPEGRVVGDAAVDGENNPEDQTEHIVEMSPADFSPSELEIGIGDKVVWKNVGGEDMWPASDNHPTHQIYSEFDPRRRISPGAEWSFVFEKEGTWEYHDHLSPGVTGKVIVK